MGQSTISMATFNSYGTNYQSVMIFDHLIIFDDILPCNSTMYDVLCIYMYNDMCPCNKYYYLLVDVITAYMFDINVVSFSSDIYTYLHYWHVCWYNRYHWYIRRVIKYDVSDIWSVLCSHTHIYIYKGFLRILKGFKRISRNAKEFKGF